MEKPRHQKDLWYDADLKREFKWIDRVRGYKELIPSVEHSYEISFKPFRTNVAHSLMERSKFEQFIADFYEVKKGRHQIVCLWQETRIILLVF